MLLPDIRASAHWQPGPTVALLGGGHLHTELPVGKIYSSSLALHRMETSPLESTVYSRRESYAWEWRCWLLCIVRSGWVPTPDSAVVQLDSPARTWSSWQESQWSQRQTGRDTCWAQSQLGSCSCRNKRRQHQTCKERVEMGLREIQLGSAGQIPCAKWHCLPQSPRTQRDLPQDWCPEQGDVSVILSWLFVCCHPSEVLGEVERRK